MTPKGGTLFFLLIMAGVALAKPPDGRPGRKHDFIKMARKLMGKCMNEDYPAPDMKQLKTIFNNSDMPMGDKKDSDTFLSTFVRVLRSVSPDKSDKDPPRDDGMRNKKWKSTNLPGMIKLMRNASEAPQCYLRAFVAPLAWAMMNSPGGDDMPADDYDTLVWAAKYAVENMPPRRMKLPTNVGRPQNLEKMMDMLKEEYDAMSKQQKTQVVKWLKEQIVQKYFNCTMRPPSEPKQMRCKPSLAWMNLKALKMMGPYISSLSPSNVDSSPKDQLCTFFQSAQFKSGTRMIRKMKPSLGMKLSQKFQECDNSMQDFANNVDKLGPVACFFTTAKDLTPELSKKLLSELKDCDANPRVKKLKKRLFKSVMSNTKGPEALRELGSSLNLLSSEKLDEFTPKELKKALKEALKNRTSSVRWKRRPLRTLVKKLLGDDKCKKLSSEEMKEFEPIAEGLPSCVLKHKEILDDTEGLKNMTKRMKKRQLMAVLQEPLKDMDPTKLLQKVSSVGPLLCSLPLDKLGKASITSLEQVADKMWCRPQAAFLVKKMYNPKKPWYRLLFTLLSLDVKLRSLLQGVTCKMIDKVPDKETLEMAQAITEDPQWLSKVLAGCAARKLAKTLEKKRDNFFKNITEEELEEIPAELLIHLPPSKVKDLPKSVCPLFLEKMEDADMSSLPRGSPSRPALARKVLLCKANGTDLSESTEEDVSKLGPLICELQPSELMKVKVPEVLKAILQEMASCEHIPQRHRAALSQLVKKTFGDDLSAETMEAVGPLLLLDDAATAALPNKPWMKDVLYFLRSNMRRVSRALGKKLFDLITASDKEKPSNRDRRAAPVREPTQELIEELEEDNVYWKASELKAMSNETFLATVETLGSVTNYNKDQLAVLSKKATENFGPVSQMNESVLLQLGCILQGFSIKDLEQISLSLDNVEEIAECGWNATQMMSLWKAVAEHDNLTAQRLGAADIVALDQFICGLSATEMGQLTMDAFKDAVASMDNVKCEYKVLQQLKMLAVSAFGDPKTWTEAIVSQLNNILAGLDKAELASLDPSVLPFISKSCIALIPPEILAGLSANQLVALGPDNAAMVTDEQKHALKEEQVDALEKAQTGSSGQSEKTEQTVTTAAPSGAPALSVEGISAVMKALLLLLMGFLLL